jgi:hypothetical protein
MIRRQDMAGRAELAQGCRPHQGTCVERGDAQNPGAGSRDPVASVDAAAAAGAERESESGERHSQAGGRQGFLRMGHGGFSEAKLRWDMSIIGVDRLRR